MARTAAGPAAGPDVVAVVLAAGEGSRMGHAKQLLPWGDSTLLGQTLHNLRKSSVQQIVVVTGYMAQEVAAIARRAGATVVHNAAYAEGEMLSSLQVAVAQLAPTCEAVLVMLADQPLVEPQVIDSLLAAFAESHEQLIAPVFKGRRGNPVLIGRRHFQELLALPRGAAPRDLLRRHKDAVHLVSVDSDSVLVDIDLPADYEAHRPTRE